MRESTQKTWGPFTGGQLTVMFVTVVVVVAFPFAASAVTSASSVSVTDAVSGAHASVSKAGALTVAPASPLNFVKGHFETPPTTFTPLIKPSSGKALVVTTLSVDAFVNTSPALQNFAEFSISTTNATCTTSVNAFELVNPPSLGATVIPLNPGVVVPAGRALCVRQGTQTGFAVSVDAYGYTIPAAAGPAGA